MDERRVTFHPIGGNALIIPMKGPIYLTSFD
jgi:hypothetical protein